MKYKGRKISEPNREYVIIPRPDYTEEIDGDVYERDGDIVFICEAVPSFAEFEKLVEMPKAPMKMVPGGERVQNFEDKSYKDRMEEYSKFKMDWMFFRSLQATPDLEWDTVKDDDPKTWGNIQEELREAGFTEIEIGRIINGILSANALDEAKLDAARERFLQKLHQSAE